MVGTEPSGALPVAVKDNVDDDDVACINFMRTTTRWRPSLLLLALSTALGISRQLTLLKERKLAFFRSSYV